MTQPTDADESDAPTCPACAMANVYPDGDNFVCADCAHEWPQVVAEVAHTEQADDGVIRDVNGAPLADGDDVVLIKSLKVKGSSAVLKQGTKIRNIRLVGGDHEVDCKVDGTGMLLKACYLRKS